ncbi:unnamed protein product [Thelazia callipaeda]|uniref:SANT domain-containing protein n=1 Tax=Thelazia callipaeda TaxID=103827 RepID=A0A0N5D0W2_THECL|nr:unnamed protein product [Thelazia callipaeda]
MQPRSEGEQENRSETGILRRRRVVNRPFSVNSLAPAAVNTINDISATEDAIDASSIATSSSSCTNTMCIPGNTATITAPSSEVAAYSQSQIGNSFIGGKSSTSASSSTINKVPRRWEHWNCTEINTFFEGIKLYGRDFEQIAKLMTRRKLNKDKDQIRNYYFNSLKLIKSSTHINESLMANIPRDAKELFILINGFEWKRRICDKFDEAKFHQLVMNGSTYEKKRKKKQLVLVRTPMCPSLQKCFPSYSSSPLPTHVYLNLTPQTEADRYFVEKRGQNPLIRIKIAMGDQISRVFSLLKMKWNLRLQKSIGCIADEKEQVQVVLYPDKTTRVGKVIVNLHETTPTVFSVNRLISELKRMGTIDESSGHCQIETSNASEELPKDSKVTDHADDCDDGPFTVNENKFRAGLTEKSVDKATVTELYYLCGKEAEIKLVYSTGMKRMGDPEPWHIFLQLLCRGYGEALCKSLNGPQKTAEADEFPERKWQEKIKKKREDTEPAVAVMSESTEKNQGSEDIVNEIVENETSAFMEQLESLKVKKRTRTFHRRFPDKRSRVESRIVMSPTFSGHPSVCRDDQLISVHSRDENVWSPNNITGTENVHVAVQCHDTMRPEFAITCGERCSGSFSEVVPGCDYFMPKNDAVLDAAYVAGSGNQGMNTMFGIPIVAIPAQITPLNSLPVNDAVDSGRGEFMQGVTQDKVISPRSSMDPERDNSSLLMLSPMKENTLLRELQSAPSMDKTIEVMLQENSTECYRFVEQFASSINSNTVSGELSEESEITFIAEQLAQSAADTLNSATSANLRSNEHRH